MNKKPKEKEFTFGTCRFERTSLQREAISSTTRAVNIYIPFEEALKFNMAVDEACRRLNKYSKSTIEGKRATLNLTIYLDVQKIAVTEEKISKSEAWRQAAFEMMNDPRYRMKPYYWAGFVVIGDGGA